MSRQKLLQLVKAVMLVIALVGCSAPKTTIALATSTQTPIPAQVPTVTPIHTPTSVTISSFEECFALGYRIQDTYPRQCITTNGVVLNETLDEGITYSKTYGTQADRTGYFITSTSEGGQLIAGASLGCWILKLDASGEKEWESDFNQELSQEFDLPGASFWCRLARETPDGGYTAMGVGYDQNFGQYRKLFMLTLDHEGNKPSAQLIPQKGEKMPYLDREGKLIWLTSLGLTALGVSRRVNETLDGGYIIAGNYEQSTPDSSTHMIKTDKNGAYVWDKNLCLDKNIQQSWEKAIVCSYNEIWDVIQLQDGSFAVLGGSWLLKTDSKGNIEWIQRVPDTGFSLLPMPDGGILIAGEKEIDQKNKDGMLIKTDPAGNFEWIRTFGGDGNDRFFAMEQRPHGEITVMGSIESFGAGTDVWLLGIDRAILK